MSCIEYQELLSGYVDEELNKKELKTILFHLENCSQCKENLTKLVLQKENLISLRSHYYGPVPDTNFSLKVMEKIKRDEALVESTKNAFKVSEILNWLVIPFKKPILVGSFSILILIGLVGGFLVRTDQTKINQKKLLSVYEIQATNYSPEKNKLAGLEEEGNSTVFHHVACSSIQTLPTEPCLVKYAAYTSPSNR